MFLGVIHLCLVFHMFHNKSNQNAKMCLNGFNFEFTLRSLQIFSRLVFRVSHIHTPSFLVQLPSRLFPFSAHKHLLVIFHACIYRIAVSTFLVMTDTHVILYLQTTPSKCNVCLRSL